MKNMAIIGFFVLLIFAISCEPPVVFGEPQPSGVKPLSQVPESYRGTYWCPVDSASLFVDAISFVRRKEMLVKLTKAEIAESPELELRGNKLYVQDWEQSFPIEQSGDTIISNFVVRDTIFNMGEHEILKPLKGHLIINKKVDENAWMVLMVSLRNTDLLAISRAKLPEDLSQLEKITDVKTTSRDKNQVTQIFITPTREQFMAILQEGLLFDGSCTEFQRIVPIPVTDYRTLRYKK